MSNVQSMTNTHYPIFKKISSLSKKNKIPVYVVGGFVRDYLLGREEKKDIDFVVEGSGVAFAKLFDEAIKDKGRLVEFAQFDTARYIFLDENRQVELEIEFAGARKELYRDTSRKPAVEPAALEEDLSRRDFTVNALAIEVGDWPPLLSKEGIRGGLPSGADTRDSAKDGKPHPTPPLEKGRRLRRGGNLIDPYNGSQDLKDKVLRTPLDPDVTFSDDPLRMLRAVRFAGQLGFSIVPQALEAIYRNRERIKIVSAERVQEELLKILALPQPSVGLLLMFQTHLMDVILPELSALDGVDEVYGRIHKNNFIHSLMVVDNIALRSDNVMLRLAGLLHDIGKAPTKRYVRPIGWTFHQHEHVGKKMAYQIAKRLRLSNDDTAYAAKLVRWHLQPIQLMDEGITDSAIRRLIVNMGDMLDDLLILGRSDITTGHPQKKVKYLGNYDRLEKHVAEVIEKDKMRAFQSPVRGDEIMKITGLKPGPKVGEVKKAIEEAILDGMIPNEYEAAMKYLLQMKGIMIKKDEDKMI